MDFSFFRENNKSGYKTNEKWLSTNHPELYSKIIKHSDNIEISFKEKIIFFYLNIKKRPKCLNCDNNVKFRNRLDNPYGEFCSIQCFNNNKDEMINRIKTANNIKYGVDYYPQDKDFIQKVKKTKKDRYGDENYINIEKSKLTRLYKYGDQHYNNIDKQKSTNLIKYGCDNVSKSDFFKEHIDKKYRELYSCYDIINITKEYVNVKCEKCGNTSNIHKQLMYERNKSNHDVCLICNPLGQSNKSKSEDEIFNFLSEYTNNVKQRVKVGGVEIDILVDDKIGIEFNGLWWHNELHKSNTFHLSKTNICNQNNISLIHIFEDEWLYKKDIVKSILLNRLGFRREKIYGRKCELRYVSSIESDNFLNQNHIQGSVKSSVRIGAFYNNEMVSLITFSKGRILMGGKKDEWELNRFCNKKNMSVIGVFSKMMKKFNEEHNPTKIVSYSDIRLFDGNLYEKNNFTKISTSRPNYWYVVGDVRRHRFHYRKSKLVKDGFDPNSTEKEIMFNRKIYRIYDCGNIRWEYNLQNKNQ
jgi:hypothetical protein